MRTVKKTSNALNKHETFHNLAVKPLLTQPILGEFKDFDLTFLVSE